MVDFDPKRNSFMSLINFVSTGEDTPVQKGAQDESEEPTNESDNHHHHHHHKKKDKKKKDESDGEEAEAPEPKADKKKKKKEKKKKDKKKKKKHKEGNDGADSSELELDSDDDLTLGSMPSSSSDDEDEEEAADKMPSQLVSKRASIVEGLKDFKLQMNFPEKPTTASPTPNAAKPNRRHTYGAALKGFQVDVTSLQDNNVDHSDSSLDNLTCLSDNLPRLSVAGVRQREALGQLLKKDKDHSENSK